jgi:hypothetical protein
LRNHSATLLNGRIGATVSVMYEPDRRRFRPKDGDAVKSYGLSIDGVEIESAESAVNKDRGLAHFVLPGIGLMLVGMGYPTLRRWRHQQG